eukprot:m.7196 g.7196  ORF g.7196 m.7196 type:complete len:429 (-) comp2727_c0_seq1:58-1344(-)
MSGQVVVEQPHGGDAVTVGREEIRAKIANFTTQYDAEEGTFVVFELVTECGEDNAFGMPAGVSHEYRRFTNFHYFSQYLNAAFPYVIVPPIPEKKVNFSIERMAIDVTDEDFLRRRSDGFNVFIEHVVAHPILVKDKGVHAFLTRKDWKEHLFYTPPRSEEEVLFSGKSWRDTLSNFSISRKGNPPPEEFVNFKNFSALWFDNIAATLKAHEGLALNVQDTVDVHEELKAGFRRLADVEDGLNAPLKATASAMMKIAEATDKKLLFEQRDMAEALYNLLLFSNSIKAFLKHEEIENSNVENAREALSSKQKTLQAIIDPEHSTGIGSMWTRLTTSKSEEKIASLKQDVVVLEQGLKDATARYDSFVEKGKEEIEYFHKMKKNKMLTIFRDFAEIQQKHASAMIKFWNNVRTAVKPRVVASNDDDEEDL